jgi:hypothetical protein
VPGFVQVVDDLLFELESGMVRAEVDAHARNPYLPVLTGAMRD